jgi:hypothetical protein
MQYKNLTDEEVRALLSEMIERLDNATAETKVGDTALLAAAEPLKQIHKGIDHLITFRSTGKRPD